MTEIPTLEEQAAARQRAANEVVRARRLVEDLSIDYDAACSKLREARKQLDEIDQAMATIKRVHMTRQALIAKGIEYEEPLVIDPEQKRGFRLPYFLMAVGPKGTGLYISEPRHRGKGGSRSYAIHATHAEQQNAVVPAGHRYGRTHQSDADAGLLIWEARGKDIYGGMDGTFKQMAPPEGGRWRWLKIEDQGELEV